MQKCSSLFGRCVAVNGVSWCGSWWNSANFSGFLWLKLCLCVIRTLSNRLISAASFTYAELPASFQSPYPATSLSTLLGWKLTFGRRNGVSTTGRQRPVCWLNTFEDLASLTGAFGVWLLLRGRCCEPPLLHTEDRACWTCLPACWSQDNSE